MHYAKKQLGGSQSHWLASDIWVQRRKWEDHKGPCEHLHTSHCTLDIGGTKNKSFANVLEAATHFLHILSGVGTAAAENAR